MSYENRKRQRMAAEVAWKMADVKRQVDSGFPLRRVTNDLASRAFLAAMEGYDREGQLRYLRALCKAQDKAMRNATREKLTAEEDAILQEVQNRINQTRNDLQNEWHNQASKEPDKITRSKVASLLVSGLKSTLGPTTSRLNTDLYFTTAVADWYLETILLIGRRPPFTVSLFHQFLRWPDEVAPLTECSLLVQGRWELARESDMPPLIEALQGISRFVLDAAPAIVDQITDHTPYPYPENEKYITASNPWSAAERALVQNIKDSLSRNGS